MQAMDARVKRRARSLYTVKQLATLLGVDESTVRRMEARPLSPLLSRYLSLVGYHAAFYPRRKAKE